MKLTHEQIAAIFNEWARRYADDPDSFGEILDRDGNPMADYGEVSAVYFAQIATELAATA